MTKVIELSNGKVSIVDDSDFDTLSKYKWSFHGKYAHRVELVDGKNKHIYMHRNIMMPLVGYDVDHMNGDKLDNRRSNLRVCTRSQNNSNMGKPSNNTSGYKGVSWDKRANKWVARLNNNGKLRWSKHFGNKIDAAKAYNSVVFEVFGQFAKLNNIKETI